MSNARKISKQGSSLLGMYHGVITGDGSTKAYLKDPLKSVGNKSQVVTVQADPENAGFILIGAYGTLTSSSYGLKLEPGQIALLNQFQIDNAGVLSTQANDKLSFMAEG